MPTEATAAAPATETAPATPPAAELRDTLSDNSANPTTAETPPTEAPKAQPDRLGPKFAALAREEKRIREEKAALKAQAAEVEQYKALRETVKQRPTAVLETFGVTLEQLVDATLADGREPTADEKVAALERKIAERDAAEAAAKAKAEEQQIATGLKKMRDAIATEAKQAGDKFELVNAEGDDAYDLAFDVVQAYWDQHKQLLPFQSALEQVEQHLEDKASKYLKLKKIAARLKPLESQNPGERQNATTTLTNRLAAEVPAVSKPGRLLSREESLRQAAALLRYRD